MPSRTSKSASSAFPRTVTGRGARNSGVAASGTTAPAAAATSAANNPSATPTSAGAPRCRLDPFADEADQPLLPTEVPGRAAGGERADAGPHDRDPGAEGLDRFDHRDEPPQDGAVFVLVGQRRAAHDDDAVDTSAVIGAVFHLRPPRGCR